MLKKRMTCLWTVAVCITFMGFNVVTYAGDLEPSAPPASTMKTLDEIPPTWSQKLPAAERFELVLDGAAVLDKETGVVWDKSPDNGFYTWTNAIRHCYQREIGGRKGWRPPTAEELSSLVDSTQSPAFPSGHPFTEANLSLGWYWSSTTVADDTTIAWGVSFMAGNVDVPNRVTSQSAWCVRGGQ